MGTKGYCYFINKFFDNDFNGFYINFLVFAHLEASVRNIGLVIKKLSNRMTTITKLDKKKCIFAEVINHFLYYMTIASGDV